MISVFSAMTRSLDASSARATAVATMVMEQSRPKTRPIEPQIISQNPRAETVPETKYRSTRLPNKSRTALRRFEREGLRRRRRRQRQHRIDRLGVARGAELFGDVLVAQKAGDAGERLEVIGAGAFGGEQQEDEIDRLAVHRFEIDWTIETREQAEDLFQLGQLAVGNGDAVADRGGAELFALQEHLENGTLVLPGQLGGLGREFLKRLLLAVDLQCRENRLGRDQIGNRHGSLPR